jgi:hypothetical protein
MKKLFLALVFIVSMAAVGFSQESSFYKFLANEYYAVEDNFSQFHPINIGVKLGVEKFYYTLNVAYNPIDHLTRKDITLGPGFGAIIPINKYLFINPELCDIVAKLQISTY